MSDGVWSAIIIACATLFKDIPQKIFNHLFVSSDPKAQIAGKIKDGIIPKRINKREYSFVFCTASHFYFLSSECHPRRPLCPDCLNEGYKTFLVEKLDYDSAEAIGADPIQRELYCQCCKKSFPLPTGQTLKLIQEECEWQLQEENT